MSAKFTPCDIFENLRQFQQHSLFTDLSIFCYDGSLSAHKAMLADVFNSLGITELEKIDGLVVPDVALAQVDYALACLYGEGSSDQMVQLCSFMKVESEVSDSSNQETGNSTNKEHYQVIDEVGEPLTVRSNVKQEDFSPTKTVSKKLYCDQCEYVSERKSRLEKNKVARHENNGYGCEYCDFRSGGKYKLESTY